MKKIVVDLVSQKLIPSELVITDGKIAEIRTISEAECNGYILPGFVDAHVHIESSLLVPREFARLAVVHGTVATVSDPHEIANVLGVEGVNYMLSQLEQCPLKIFLGAPSCVPATAFETAGGKITVTDVEQLLADPRILYLAEVMNFPGVLAGDKDLLAMIEIAKSYSKQVDGHAPGLRGDGAKQYAAAGITTDHECFSEDEARDKLAAGMSIIIREGSAAKNFDALIPLLEEFPERIMFGTDDAHPDYLSKGHINLQVKRAIERGIDLFKVLRAASLNPVRHYNLPVGLLQLGDPADFIVVDNLTEFNVLSTFINGVEVAKAGSALFEYITPKLINNFQRQQISAEELVVESNGSNPVKVIEVIPGELITNSLLVDFKTAAGESLTSDQRQDLLKLVVVNRYSDSAAPAIAFAKGFGFASGAIASSVAHDSHNIVAVGVSDEEILAAINLVISTKGGLSIANGEDNFLLPLEIAGLISKLDCQTVAKRYSEMDSYVKTAMNCSLSAPFMSLSFLALPVIPSLKLSDLGLFDVDAFRLVELQAGSSD